MKHLDDIELIEYAAGNLTEPRAAEVREHIAACRQCSQRVQETDKLWETLGHWDVETAGHDVAGRISAMADETRLRIMPQRSTHAVRKRFLLQALRVAASIIIAIGLGNKLGRYSITGRKPQTASSQQKPEYLAALGLEWSSGLAWLVLEEEPAETGGDQ
jgi:anti-sigma factor RsiW